MLDGFRSRHIPLDVIVQDWQCWKTDSWGSHAFDKDRFRIPTAGSSRSDKHAKVMISVWGKFYPGTANFEAMHDAGISTRATQGQAEGLARIPYLLRPLQRRRAEDVLGPARAGALRQGRGRVVDGCHRTRSRATARDAGRAAQLRTPTGMGTGARAQRLLPREQHGHLRGPACAAPDKRVVILTRSRSPASSATHRPRGRATSARRGPRCASRSLRA